MGTLLSFGMLEPATPCLLRGTLLKVLQMILSAHGVWWDWHCNGVVHPSVCVPSSGTLPLVRPNHVYRILYLLLHCHSSRWYQGWWLLKIHTLRQWCRCMWQYSLCSADSFLCMTLLVPCWLINRSISLQLTILRILMPRKVWISLKHTVDPTPAWVTWCNRALTWCFPKFVLPITLGVIHFVCADTYMTVSTIIVWCGIISLS